MDPVSFRRSLISLALYQGSQKLSLEVTVILHHSEIKANSKLTIFFRMGVCILCSNLNFSTDAFQDTATNLSLTLGSFTTMQFPAGLC